MADDYGFTMADLASGGGGGDPTQIDTTGMGGGFDQTSYAPTNIDWGQYGPPGSGSSWMDSTPSSSYGSTNYSYTNDPSFNTPFMQGLQDPFGNPTGGMGGNYAQMAAMARQSGAMGMGRANATQASAGVLGASMNPFDPYRSTFAKQLMQLQADPSTMMRLPGYQAGLQAVQRTQGAQGYQGSGQMMNELAGFGQNFYDQQMQRLSGLAGANAAPGAGAGLMYQGVRDASNLMGQSQASYGFAAGLGY